MTKRMLERAVKQKNKYKTDLEVLKNENTLMKLQMEAMKKRLIGDIDSFVSCNSEIDLKSESLSAKTEMKIQTKSFKNKIKNFDSNLTVLNPSTSRNNEMKFCSFSSDFSNKSA